MPERDASAPDAARPAGASDADDWDGGWWRGARRIESPNHGPRPAGAQPELVVLHSISLPPGEYGGGHIEAFFTNRLDHDAHPYFQTVRGLEVSAHFVVRRDGAVEQYVDVLRRAWHAGRSSWRGRDNCNDWSVGIELEGLEGEVFATAQYRALLPLLAALAARWPLGEVVGHEHVAPGRKRDPGPGFDWGRLRRGLARRSVALEVVPQGPAARQAGAGRAA